jgi:hypothetical protein
MVDNDEDHGRNRRPGVEDRRWSHRSDTPWPDDREVGWPCVRSVPCTMRRGARVSWFCLKTRVDGLLVVSPQNHWDSFFWFGLKTGRYDFIRVGLKTSGNDFSRFVLKTDGFGFSVWASKPTAMVWWFRPQNHCDYFLVWATKPSGLLFVGCATKSIGGWRRCRAYIEI